MKNLSRCKVCGYIMETDQIQDLCPACGLPAKVFEPYSPTMSEERFKLLSLHMHPIILHFPQAFVVTALGMLILGLMFTGALQQQILLIAKFNVVFLPPLVLVGALSGMKDGQLRFKKITTPVLKYKMILSAAFFGLSVLAAILAMVLPLTPSTILILAVLMMVSSLIAVVLGRTGAKLMDSFMPGK